MNLLIRKADVTDAEEIHTLIKKLAPLFLEQIQFDQLASFKLENYKGYLESPLFQFYVAIQSGKLIGVIALKHPSHLYHLYVAEEYHRKGIAKKLWCYLRCYQIKKFPDQKIITVNSSLYAVDMYKKFGFSRLVEGHKEINGIQYVPMQYLVI